MSKTQKKINSKAISVKELETREEMLIIYSDGRFFPKCAK